MGDGRRILKKKDCKSRKKILQKNKKESHSDGTDDMEELELMNLKKYFYKLIKTNMQHLEQDIDIGESKSEVVGEPKINIEIQKEAKYINGLEIIQIIGIADIETDITLQDKIIYVNQLLPFSIIKIKEK